MTLLVANTTVRELLRRRGALLLVVLLPLAFYLTRLDTMWTALRLLALGLGWAVATLALFTHVDSRDLDRRLVVAGAGPLPLHLGRQLAVTGIGLALAVGYFLLVAVTEHNHLTRLAPVAVILVVTVVLAAPLGAVVAALVPRQLEGALTLLAIMAVQVLVDPTKDWTMVLPMWSTREISSYAVQDVGPDYLWRGLAHGGVALCLLVAASAAVAVARLRLVAVAVIAQPCDR